MHRILGEGGMAVVLEVEHTELGTRHAMKVLQIGFPGLDKRLILEGQIQARAQHANIVSVTDVVRIEGSPALVMALVDGPALDQLLVMMELDVPQIDVLARGILAGVAAAHGRGMVHRDLKPANILVAVEGDSVVPKVADFGLAKVLDRGGGKGPNQTRSGMMMGTPQYMAPEQARDASRADARADVFALGAILYELCAGVPAFPGLDNAECFAQAAAGQFLPLAETAPHVPARMADTITACLRPNPDDRPASVDDLLAEWTAGTPFPTAAFDAVQRAQIRSLAPSAGSQPVPYPPTLAPPEASSPQTPPPPATKDRRWVAGLFSLGGVGVAGLLALTCGLWGTGTSMGWWAETPIPVEQAALVLPPSVVPAPEPPVIAPEPPVREAVPAPLPVARPAVVAVVPAPAPVAPEPALPEPAVAAPAAPQPTGASLTLQGAQIVRAYLIDRGGAQRPLTDVAPGTYDLFVHFAGQERPIRVKEAWVMGAQDQTMRCDQIVRVCRP